jgi:hypothetical protein
MLLVLSVKAPKTTLKGENGVYLVGYYEVGMRMNLR